jgi:hypothetical protein
MKITGIALGLVALLAGGTASAKDYDYDYDRHGNLLTDKGMSFSVGGGVVGMSDDDANDVADAGGSWEARFVAGTRTPFAIEGAYVGTAQGIDALGLDEDAVLIGTGLEAAVRYNLNAQGTWVPYALVGAGWKRYDLANEDFNLSSVEDDDNVFEVPLGIGLAYRLEPVVIDARGTFRAAMGEDLFGGDDTPLHNWGATLRAGFEF